MALTDEEKTRRKAARDGKRAISLFTDRIASGSGTVELLQEVLNHPVSMLPQKLAAIEAAYESRLLDKREVTGIQTAPNHEDYGLPWDDAKTLVERAQEAVFPDGQMAPRIATALFVGSWIAGSIYLHDIEGMGTLAAIFSGAFSIIPTMFAGMIAAAIWSSLCDAHGKQTKAIYAYREAKLRFSVIQQIRNVMVKANAASSLYEATGPEFEVLVASVFRKWGFQVDEVGGVNDGGVDLVVNRGEEKALV